MKSLKVFISYSHSDTKTVNAIEKWLLENDIPYFRDTTDIQLGQAIPPAVINAIRSSSHVLVIVSPGSEKSPWVNYEMGLAHGLGADILPLLTHSRQDVPLFIGNLRCATKVNEIFAFLSRVRESEKLRESICIPTRPDADAAQLASRDGHKELVVGTALEVWTHKSLDTKVALSEMGASPDSFSFTLQPRRSFEHALGRCGGLKDVQPPNSKKFGIAKLPVGTTDDESRVVQFFETDWQTWISVRDVVAQNPELRLELTSVLPEKSLLPQSMSFQFIVRFRDGEILAMKRNSNLNSHPDRWSFSGEEQISERDFNRTGTCAAQALVQRAFVEEILGSRDSDQAAIDRIWRDDCQPLMVAFNIWTFFLEEVVGSFHAFGVYQLNISPTDLRELHVKATAHGWGTTDDEGKFYFVEPDAVETLLIRGACDAVPLHGAGQRCVVRDDRLHPTSRYRLWKLNAALNRSNRSLSAL
ncbi:MAG: toll/interleukin-1 receptor domain-containing protein [Verrucomicrobiae bacterium]|nr:toll/interleukin-1 receptor domain-containing protein [Verrucomicrobiae bacterium]